MLARLLHQLLVLEKVSKKTFKTFVIKIILTFKKMYQYNASLHQIVTLLSTQRSCVTL